MSFTGGEPLLSIDFMKEFLPQCKLPVYLETNGTLYENLEQVIKYVDFISADIKLSSCTSLNALWDKHEKFFEIASGKKLFAKMVFDNSITDEEIEKASLLCNKYNIELILQPKMNGNIPAVNSAFMEQTLDKCLAFYKHVRLIPQVHKFIDVQ